MNVLDGVMPDLVFLQDPRLRIAAVAAIVLALAVTAARIVLHRLDARAGSRRGRLVLVAAPPEVDEAGAVRLWQHLAQCERSAWRKFWFGQPHLVWEFFFTGPRLTVRIWVPGGVSVPMIRDAVHAAWPGAQTTVTDTVTEIERKTP
jgi:hypothetical protein